MSQQTYFQIHRSGPRATEVSVVMPHLLALVAVGLIIGLSCLGCLS